MKSEAWIFGICTIFFVLVSPAYWFITGDWTGTSALTMTTLLARMVTLYLGFHAKKMDPRPEDRKDGEIADGAGELGFFPPYSWWPLWCALTLGVVRLRHRGRRLVALHHRRRRRRDGAVRLDLRVLPGRARPLTGACAAASNRGGSGVGGYAGQTARTSSWGVPACPYRGPRARSRRPRP